MKKICFISSCGGHFMELKQLFPIGFDYDYYVVTEKNKATTSLLSNKFRYYLLMQQERKNYRFLYTFLYNLIYSLFIIIKERPDFIITTGAGAVLPTCVYAKLFRTKIIYIESFAKINSKSKTGQLVYYISDLFYVQWTEMLKIYPKAIYNGSVY